MSRGGFYDFNILIDRSKRNHFADLTTVLRAAYKHGYRTVAVNTKIDGEILATSSRKGVSNKEVPSILSIPLKYILEDYKGTQDERKFTILQRLTVSISDAIQINKLQKLSAVKEYDIVAVEPLNEKAFQACIKILNMDLICLPMTSKLPMFLKTQTVNVVRNAGIFFEITYVPAMVTNNSRQITISNAQHIVSACKGRNIIVSSQAMSPVDLRGPYDVINLCYVFGAKGPLAAQFLTANGRCVVLRAECRKSNTGVATVFPTAWLPEEETWKTLECKNSKTLSNSVKKTKRPLEDKAGASEKKIGKHLKK